MIKFTPEIQKELITLSETKNLFLEGNIVKVINSGQAKHKFNLLSDNSLSAFFVIGFSASKRVDPFFSLYCCHLLFVTYLHTILEDLPYPCLK